MDYFREAADEAGGGNYQTMINDALVAYIQQRSMLAAVRQVVREELATPRIKTPRKRAREAALMPKEGLHNPPLFDEVMR